MLCSMTNQGPILQLENPWKTKGGNTYDIWEKLFIFTHIDLFLLINYKNTSLKFPHYNHDIKMHLFETNNKLFSTLIT